MYTSFLQETCTNLVRATDDILSPNKGPEIGLDIGLGIGQRGGFNPSVDPERINLNPVWLDSIEGRIAPSQYEDFYRIVEHEITHYLDYHYNGDSYRMSSDYDEGHMYEDAIYGYHTLR